MSQGASSRSTGGSRSPRTNRAAPTSRSSPAHAAATSRERANPGTRPWPWRLGSGTPLLGLTRQSPSLGTWTVPNRVALVGRVRATPAGPIFTIERLAWLRTAARQRPVLTAPGSLTTRWSREAAEQAARASVKGAGSTLLMALLDRPTLARFDAVAADAISAAGGPVWYLRTIVWQPRRGADDAPVVGWSVVDDRTHKVLATGLWPDAP